ncbi:hypothetical protein [Paraburkholderia sp. BL10I2N1]|uniref:hypothetical protein n=1 Tax=Paraburkholderia sp. BL10I2N1 TaxID=1938796 RepID=UPI00105E9400|nr:hypothetical protein [Paraburkholderia sp. BL10I2N1]TDN70424.1 hypothetical protein B0G77_3898 [Paraburkholderia sp. BL10I2N1]
MSDKLVTFDPLEDANLNVPAEMVAEMAKGIEDPVEIARRFGFKGARWDALVQWKPFLDAVQKKRAELEAEGWTFRAKAGLLAEMMLDDIGKIGLSSEVPLMQKLALTEALVKWKEPKQSATAQQGTGFSITINLPDTSKPREIDITPSKPLVE